MMTRDAYIANGGRRCPVCTEEPGYAATGMRYDGPTFLVDRRCICGAEWTEMFELHRFEVTRGNQ